MLEGVDGLHGYEFKIRSLNIYQIYNFKSKLINVYCFFHNFSLILLFLTINIKSIFYA